MLNPRAILIMVLRLKIVLVLAFMLFMTEDILAQNKKKRLQPGKLYEHGEKIYAPRFGFESVIPEGWEGTLPRESEIFLLMPDTITIGGEIFTFASEATDLKSIRDNWLKGAKLSENMLIKAKGEPVINGDMISAEVVPAGEAVNTGNKGYVVARCGSFGHCITCLAIGPTQFFDQFKTAVTNFMSSASFSEPSNVSIYVDFDWKEFLKGKMLITLMGMETESQSGTKENVVHLCADGTFTAEFRKKGIVKDYNPQYKGRQSGTWSAEGIGEQGKLKLTFKKLPEVNVDLTIKDEKITVNGERYFAAESDKCK
jgi:hypothetical protein